jgi:hypothetical protein
VLECHTHVYCFDETRAYQALLAEDYVAPPGKTLLGFKIPRWTEQLAEPWLSEAGVKEGLQVYRGEPVLFLLRDVRDTVVSMRQLKIGDNSWLERYGRPTLETMAREAGFQARFARELSLVQASGHSPASVAALYWKFKTQAYLDYRRRGWPVLGVGYEDLVEAPEPHLRVVADFLGLAWEPGLLDHPCFSHAEVAPCGWTVGHTNPRRPIDDLSVGQWQRFLSPTEEAEVMAVAGDLNEQVMADSAVRQGAV